MINNNNNNNIVLHNESDFILFLRDNEIKLTPEIRLLYEMSVYNICFVCLHIDSYIKDKNSYADYYSLKEHFIKEHTKDIEGNKRDKGSAYGRSKDDMHSFHVTTKVIAWDNSKILGLMDQMIVLESYLDKKMRMRKKDSNQKFNYYRDVGRCIVKIMKDYQIPQLIFTKYLNINSKMLEKYTTAYYYGLDDNEKPKWMRTFL